MARAAGLILDPWQELCILLGLGETAEGKWAAFQVALIVARQNGKGSILEALELYWLFVRGERLIGHSAHEYKTAMEAFRRVLFLIDSNDWLRKRVKKVINTNGEEGIELITGQRLRFMARSKGAGRGFTFHKIIWDEAYALTREQQDAQLPTMSAVDNPQIWMTSSPPLTSDTGEVLFQTRRQALASAGQLVFMDYGADGALDSLDQVDLDDQNIWRLTNPSSVHAGSGHGVSLATMARERSAMSDQGFARERLGIWPPDLTQGFGVFSKELWQGLWHPDSVPTGPPVLSLDVSPRNAGAVRTAIGIAATRDDGRKHVEVVATDAGTSWVLPMIKRMIEVSAIRTIVIDPGSPAGSLLADLETLMVEMGLPKESIIKMTSRDVAAAFGMIYDAATGTVPTLAHLGQPELDQAVGGAVKRPIGDGHGWDRRNSTSDVTPLIAVTHALWGTAQSGGHEVESEPLVMWV